MSSARPSGGARITLVSLIPSPTLATVNPSRRAAAAAASAVISRSVFIGALPSWEPGCTARDSAGPRPWLEWSAFLLELVTRAPFAGPADLRNHRARWRGRLGKIWRCGLHVEPAVGQPVSEDVDDGAGPAAVAFLDVLDAAEQAVDGTAIG